MQKIFRRRGGCSSMNLLCMLWLLAVCLAPGSRGQTLREADREQPAAGAQLPESDGICHQEGCYAVFLQKKTFRDAGRSCRERGGTLATMHTPEAAGVVHELLSAVEGQGSRLRHRLWIGLHRPPRQCSPRRPLRGFVWVTGDQDGQFTNWFREDTPGTCAVHRCVAMTVHVAETGQENKDNFQWVDGSCGVALDGYVCQYNYRGMCPPLKNEGGGPALYTTPFHLVSALLTHVPLGSEAALPCPRDGASPGVPAEQTVVCMERDDMTVDWSRDGPLCSPSGPPGITHDWCSDDHGCEHFCKNADTDYYCYCSEGFVLDEDGYSCLPYPPFQTNPPELPSDSAGPTDQPHMKEICVAMGCEYDCVETPRGTRCTCPPGYKISADGRRCSDVDECLQQPCTQQCVNTPGTFHCTCYQGYQPDDDGECTDIDECLDEGSCEGSCENTVGSFTCLCGPGFEVDSAGVCVDVDECVTESPCHQKCLNLQGAYRCACDDGFELDSDGLTCQPVNDDEEYSTLTPDPIDSADMPWSTSFTPDPSFRNFDVMWLTEVPEGLYPVMGHGSDNHLNQWDDLFQTAGSPTQKDGTGNEIENDAETGGREQSDGVAAGTVKGSTGGTNEGKEAAKVDGTAGTEDAAENGVGAATGKGKHDKGWLLVALLVPLCVFLVVMLALGIVYCTSCAVDKSLTFTDCYHWLLPTAPPERSEDKSQA